MDKRDIFRTEVPIGEILDREIKMTHKIPIKQGEEPAKIRPIPVSGPKLAVLQALVKNLLEAGVIEKGNINSEWGAPVLLLRKGGTRPGLTNSWRIVCDFRQLNAKSHNAEADMDTTQRERNLGRLKRSQILLQNRRSRGVLPVRAGRIRSRENDLSNKK
jgi:hypothetical protein